jgi:hypothetical protein
VLAAGLCVLAVQVLTNSDIAFGGPVRETPILFIVVSSSGLFESWVVNHWERQTHERLFRE